MFLSFIVPVYNVEDYLAECLDSLLDQDIPHEDYEIICINDGSTDGSLTILRDYEVKNSNIRVIDQENGGAAIARNHLIATAGIFSSEYDIADSEDDLGVGDFYTPNSFFSFSSSNWATRLRL